MRSLSLDGTTKAAMDYCLLPAGFYDQEIEREGAEGMGMRVDGQGRMGEKKKET